MQRGLTKFTGVLLSLILTFSPVSPVYAVDPLDNPANPGEQPTVPYTETLTTETQTLESEGDIVITAETSIDPEKNLVIDAGGDVFINAVIRTTGDVLIRAAGKIIFGPDAYIDSPGNVELQADEVEGNGPLSSPSEDPNGQVQIQSFENQMQLNGTINLTTVSAMPHHPKVEATGYSSTNRSQYPGYVSFVPGADQNNFSYRYDVGAAAGATVDVTIKKSQVAADLSGGPFLIRLRRENAVGGFDGLDEISIIFVDALNNKIEQRLTLDDEFQTFEIDLDQDGFHANIISSIILRQTYSDIDLVNYQEERRGEIFVNLGNLDVPVRGNELGFNRELLTELPSGTRVQSEAFIRGNHTVPGFITVFDEDGEDEIRSFRYDVGGSDGAVVQAEILPPQNQVFDLPQSFVMGMKNDGNGADALVRLTDEDGTVQEYLVHLTDSFQTIFLNFPDANVDDFNHQRVTRIEIEVTRKLSPERRGRIDFYIPVAEQDPFTLLQPAITSATADVRGQASIAFSALQDASVYQVQISRNAAFTDIIHEGFPASSPETYSFPESGNFFIRVRGSKSAQVETGPVSQWSPTANLTVTRIIDQKPAVQTVSTDEVTGVTRIDYSAVTGASIYHVQIARDANFTNVVHNGFPSGTFETVNLETNATYYVRIKGSVSGDFVPQFTSQWSNTFSFVRDVPDRDLEPDANLTEQDLTVFPDGTAGAPGVTSLGSGGDSSDSAQATDRGVVVTYDTGSQAGGAGGFAGGGFSYDNFGTGQIETGDISALENLVIGLKGTADRVKFEIVDADNNKTFVYLNSIASDTEQFWSIPVSLLIGIDLTRVRLFYFIVEGHDNSGTLEINRLPSTVVSRNLNPDASLAGEDITALPEGPVAGTPFTTSLGSGGNSQDSSQRTERGVQITYNTGTSVGGSGGFAGGGFTYDDFGSQAVESGDLSGMEHWVFGIQGDAASLKIEVVDASGASSAVHLHNISSSEEQFWKIPTSLFDTVDLAQVRIIYFIVEGHGQSGTFQVNRVPLILPLATLTTDDIVDFSGGKIQTGEMPLLTIAPNDGSANMTPTSDNRGAELQFNTGPSLFGFAGGGVSYDSFATQPKETGDLSGVQELRFGLKGPDRPVQLVIEDAAGNRQAVVLDGVDPSTEKVWAIPLDIYTLVDLTQVTNIFFLYEGQNVSGSLFIYIQPTS